MKYVASGQIKDWRYANTEHGIMTTLYIGKFVMGRITPSDDIAELAWLNPSDINIERDIMVEHQEHNHRRKHGKMTRKENDHNHD